MPADGTARCAARRDGLAQRRKALGLTQEALAALLDIDRSTVARWERGEAEPLPWLRPRLARALGVSSDRIEALLAMDVAGAASAAPPHQLPAAVPRFTGRATELAALTKILDDADGKDAPGTVVISAIGGTAGVGKTALAIQWAHQAAGRFHDGQLYVNLRGHDPDRPMPPADALAGFLRALGVAGPDIPPGEDERAARYRSLVADRRMLVVLDNAWSAEQVRPLLPASRSCAVLVTSRDSLAGLVARDGANRLDLDVLPLTDAVRLLRALIGGRATADPAATEALAQRCCRLPLAIRVAAELAASRPDAPLASLVEELSDRQGRLDLLAAGDDPRTAVREVFSWSYRHLDADAARAFRLAGLHPAADFDAFAVAALTNTSIGLTRRVLETLARAHLVQPAGPGRHGMHDLLRAYASELADACGGADAGRAALTRLLDYYLGTAAAAMDIMYPAERHRRPPVYPARTPRHPMASAAAARSWLDSELPALTAVARYAARHGWPGHATKLSAALWRYLDAGGHYSEAIIIHASARIAARQEGDRAAEATAVNSLGTIDGRQGRYQQATSNFLAARELFQQVGQRQGEALTLSNLGATCFGQSRYQEAASFYEQALGVWKKAGDRLGEAITLVSLGHLMSRQGHYPQAIQALWQSISICREIGNRPSECWALVTLGQISLLREDYQEAGDLLRRSLDLARAGGYRPTEARARLGLGNLCRLQGHTGEALNQLSEALAMFRRFGDQALEAEVLNSLGETYLAASRPGEAREHHAAALRLTIENGDRFEQARAHDGLGRAGHALGDTTEACRHWEQALDIYVDLDVPEAAQVRAQLALLRNGQLYDRGAMTDRCPRKQKTGNLRPVVPSSDG